MRYAAVVELAVAAGLHRTSRFSAVGSNLGQLIERSVATVNLRICLILLLAFCPAVIPAAAQNDLYDNGPTNGTVNAWAVNFGFVVSDSFTLGSNSQVNGLTFSAWLFPGDAVVGGEVSITSSEFGGTTYFDEFINLTQSGCVMNQIGFNVCSETGSFGPINLNAGTYWLNLFNVENWQIDEPVYWDENSGPSQASQNSVGTIPSESFTLLGTVSSGTGGTTPEPSSIMLFGSGILGALGFTRRKFFH